MSFPVWKRPDHRTQNCDLTPTKPLTPADFT